MYKKRLLKHFLLRKKQFYPTDEIIDCVNNTFTHSGLSRGNTYNYRLAAYNSYIPKPGKDFIITIHPEIITVPLMNTKPESPANLLPQNDSTITGKFDWDKAFDLDGDQLQYHIYIKRA